MELRQLVYFDAVVRHASFTRAAADLHIAQPAISAQVRNLERELDVRLLARTTRSVELTPVGATFLEHARHALAHLDEARAQVAAHQSVDRGHLRIGMTPVTGSLDVIACLKSFRLRYPGVTVSLVTDRATPLLTDLSTGALDLVIAPAHDEHRATLAVTPVAEESAVLITPPTDTRHITSIADVLGDTFACLPAGSGLDQLLRKAFDSKGRSPRIDFEVVHPAQIRDLVSAGLAVALVAHSTAAAAGTPVRMHHLSNPAIEHPLICVYRRRGHADAATDRFVETLRA